MKEHSLKLLEELYSKYVDTKPLARDIERAIHVLLECTQNGGTVFLCGNGGSAADAEHIVGELMKSFLKKRPVNAVFTQDFIEKFPEHSEYVCENLEGSIRAISLVSGVSLPTAYANDAAPDLVFAQQLYGLATEKDVVWGISTSGNSKNVNYALRVAKVLCCKTIGLSGKSGGEMATLLDVEIRINSNSTPAIQELHLPIYHCICAVLENELF